MVRFSIAHVGSYHGCCVTDFHACVFVLQAAVFAHVVHDTHDMPQKCLSSCLICLLFGLPESNLNMFKHRCQSKFFCHTKAWPSLPKPNPNNTFLTQHKRHTASIMLHASHLEIGQWQREILRSRWLVWPPKVRPKDDGVQIALKEKSQCLRSPCLVGNLCFVEFLEIFWRMFCWCSRIHHWVARPFSTFSWNFVEWKRAEHFCHLTFFDVWLFDSFDFHGSVLIFVVSQLSFHHVQEAWSILRCTLTDCEKSLALGRSAKQGPVGELTGRSRLDLVRPF